MESADQSSTVFLTLPWSILWPRDDPGRLEIGWSPFCHLCCLIQSCSPSQRLLGAGLSPPSLSVEDVLFQILRYGLGALFRNRRLGAILSMPFFWVRFIDDAAPASHASDCASGVFFLGRRSEQPIRPSDMPAFFKGVQ